MGRLRLGFLKNKKKKFQSLNMRPSWCVDFQECLAAYQQKLKNHQFRIIKGTLTVQQSLGRHGPGRSASVQLCSSDQVDVNTGKGKLSNKVRLRKGKNSNHNDISAVTYQITFRVDPEFGIPGALIVINRHKNEFLFMSATVEIPGDRVIHFQLNSWVYPIRKTNTHRIFFSNTCYLPNRTPQALKEVRREELIGLRGDGSGERKEWERIYDYAYYNDLGNPDKGRTHARPVLGGTKEHPYPRRGRTGRPPTKEDPLTESRPGIFNLDIYVPPDERFSPKKMSDFISTSTQAITHFLIPEAKSLFQRDFNSFQSLDKVRDMFSGSGSPSLEGWMAEKLKILVPDKVYKEIARLSKERPLKFPLPQIIAVDELAWKDDEEFGREMLAGINPAMIERLKTFPPVSKKGLTSSIRASHIEKNLDGLTVHDAMEQWRLFILDHHDHLMPYLNRINSQDVCIYASRTILFKREDGTLKPVAIELSLPASTAAEAVAEEEVLSRVFVPRSQGSEGALWQLAKAHVAVNDSGYHQLISHWLHTHATVEPFIIATRRQLSVMHPVHRLLEPHFKDTMHINALARSLLLSAGSVLEKTLFPGKFSIELSSALYKEWRFDEQALPADLLKRGLAIEDSNHPSGVRLIFEDYPYAADGLEIWMAIKTWVGDYCSIFYRHDVHVIQDEEIQAWWDEIRREGHGDKLDEKWWCKMKTVTDLVQTLTTLIWISSALHAAVNFGQYAYGGYPLNRPSLCRKFIPEEGTEEFAALLEDPDKYFMKMLPDRFTTTLGIASVEVLSTHMSDEVFIGQRAAAEWTDNDDVHRAFDRFGERLREVEKVVLERNSNPKLKNRTGPARIPYTLLYPDASNVDHTMGITGKGIPNSVSI